MMGHRKADQNRLFYSFNLDDQTPQNHLLRGIDQCLDLSDLRKQLADHYSHTGRPSIDPELMIRMLIVGYCYAIRSERRLCEEVHLNLAYRWFCRLGLEEAVPDHSTFSKNRHGRFRANGTFRWLFEEVVRRCMAAGLVDTAYGTAPMLGWMVEEKGIEPHMPIFDKTARKDGTFQRDEFQWDEAADEYRCPAGKLLRSNWRPFKRQRSHVTKADTIIYRSSERDCVACPMKAQCCPNMRFRKIARSVHEKARDVARTIATTPEYQRSRYERRKVEMLFAHLKSILKLDRLRLHGLSGANDEFTLAATVQNLRRMAKLIAQGPPTDRIGAPA